ncbi:hypothetical protein UPYG_G00205270 [Umbra pygmaea]|uniref:HAT C-terminal dimerisation domain-containing protein n=1 Tax=Umbra pygmaea TaxID=75934 RepID=A0ABD0X574_UMBPY
MPIHLSVHNCRPGPNLRAVLDADTYEGVLLKPTDANQHDMAKNVLIDSLCRCITARFSDVNSGAGYAADQFPVLARGRHEFSRIQTQLYTAGFSQGTFENTWPTVSRMLRHWCPDVLDLFDALLTILASTADCERGFSVMKQVKSDWRSRLKGQTLSDLLKTQLCSPDIKDFDPAKAIEIWHADSLCSNRPDFVRKHGTKVTESGLDSDGTSEEDL